MSQVKFFLVKMGYLSKLQVKERLGQITNPRPSWCEGYKIPRANDLINQPPVIGYQIDLVTRLPITNICRHRLINGTLECQQFAPQLYVLLLTYIRTKRSPEDWRKLFPRRDEDLGVGWPVFAPISSEFPNCPGYHYIQVCHYLY